MGFSGKALLVGLGLTKIRTRTQLCDIFTDDGRIVPLELNVGRGCCIDSEHESAYLIDASNQVRGDDNKFYQLIADRSIIPISLIKETPFKDARKLINAIYKEACDTTKIRQYQKAKENKNWQRFTFITAAFVIAAMVIVFINGGF